jgi:hypothetical protein
VTNQLGFDRDFGPGFFIAELRGKGIQHGLCQFGTEKPTVETLPEFPQLAGQRLRPALVEISLISVAEVV